MKRDKVINRALSIFFTILSLAWIYPVFMIALNSFKKATAISTTTAFDLLTPETFNGLANYMHALNEQGFASAFMYSLIITVTSVVLILVCCSMCAWYVVRVNNKISNFFYYLFVFSMVVPFQMLMFTLSNLADRIGFNTPFNICFIYLGDDFLKAECFFLCQVLSSLCILCIKSCLFLLSSRILFLQDVAASE